MHTLQCATWIVGGTRPQGLHLKARSPKLPCAHPTKTIDRRIIESSVVIFKGLVLVY